MENKEHPTRKVFDVVCGMELDIENVRHSFEYNGIEYYFCSDNCKEHFVEDPEKYIGEN
ncbi:MAG: YHS domain-containing protein [Patescibacteria group bacterium]